MAAGAASAVSAPLWVPPRTTKCGGANSGTRLKGIREVGAAEIPQGKVEPGFYLGESEAKGSQGARLRERIFAFAGS